MIITYSVYDDFLVTIFMNVHKIVHDFIFFFIAMINPVIKRVFGVIGFSVFGDFVNNWIILFSMNAFLKCLERRFLLA